MNVGRHFSLPRGKEEKRPGHDFKSLPGRHTCRFTNQRVEADVKAYWPGETDRTLPDSSFSPNMMSLKKFW